MAATLGNTTRRSVEPLCTLLRTRGAAGSLALLSPQGGIPEETRRPGGGQRFTVKRPILDGCHACALLGAAQQALNFAPSGAPLGRRIVAVRAGRSAWFGR